MFYSNLDSLQPQGWKVAKEQNLHNGDNYEGVTKVSVTLETGQ